MLKNKNVLIVLLTGLLVLFVFLYIFKSPQTIVEPFDDTPYREEIQKRDSIISQLEADVLYWEDQFTEATDKVDSLENTKPTIIYEYSKVYNLIPDGTAVQLDSIIRANW